MSVIDVFCRSCNAVHPHATDDNTIVCTGCGAISHADTDVLTFVLTAAEQPVLDMRDCRWCNEMKPVGHDCPAGAVGCTDRQPEETPCGECDRCREVQRQDLGRRAAEFEHGSPSDLLLPEETP